MQDMSPHRMKPTVAVRHRLTRWYLLAAAVVIGLVFTAIVLLFGFRERTEFVALMGTWSAPHALEIENRFGDSLLTPKLRAPDLHPTTLEPEVWALESYASRHDLPRVALLDPSGRILFSTASQAIDSLGLDDATLRDTMNGTMTSSLITRPPGSGREADGERTLVRTLHALANGGLLLVERDITETFRHRQQVKYGLATGVSLLLLVMFSIVYFPVRRGEQALVAADEDLRRSAAELEQRVVARTLELRQSEVRFKNFAEAASDWFWEMDADLRVCFCSENAHRILGFPAGSLIGKSRDDLGFQVTPPTDAERHAEEFNNHRPFRDATYMTKTPDGRTVHMRVSGQPLFDGSGAFLGYRGSSVDITAAREAEAEVSRARLLLADALESITDGFILWDDQDRLVLANQYVHENLGSRAGLLSKGDTCETILRQLVDSGVIDTGRAPPDLWLAETMRSHRTPEGPRELTLSSGRLILARENKTRLGGTVSIYQDITELRRAQQKLELSERSVQEASDGIFWILENGDLMQANRAALKLLDQTAVSLTGLKAWDINPELSPEQWSRFWQSIHRRQTWFGQVRMRSRLGTEIDVEMACNMVSHEGQRYVLAMVRDIRMRLMQEAALYRAKEEAEAANRAKTQFLATMSHELRTPLNAIIGFSDILIHGLMGPVENPRHREYLEDIRGSGNHLLEVINDILDMAKVESGTMAVRNASVDLARILGDVLRLTQAHADEAEVDLVFESDELLPRLLADPNRLKQILLNVVTNGIKFTPAGGSVTLGVARLNDGLILTIDDTGIGMAPEDIPTALTPFGQIDSDLARRYEGTGLGLPLVAHLMELHDGRLRLDSTPGCGTKVGLWFPLERVVDQEMEKVTETGT
ncbi:PAS domain S-box protein [Magnetospira sp. QH-2]|uniref:PAS domain S-box protein n=1 Tax=Magnetospira sp. (strain QH-2) TaxID=1288970 RepID=UPI0003E80F31|nr:PAS domain S-box protein [Magnetospira sp. QH-2]CCQ75430.1 putative Histidine kinase with PAS sensor domain [Magnetospira sp. QH-2]